MSLSKNTRLSILIVIFCLFELLSIIIEERAMGGNDLALCNDLKVQPYGLVGRALDVQSSG